MPVQSAALSLDAGRRSLSALSENLLLVGVATLAFTVFQPIDAIVCSQLSTGCMSIISYSQRITMALGTVISLGAFIVAAKTSSDVYRDGGLPAIRALANRETLRILCLGLAAWGLFSAVGAPIIRALFQDSEMGNSNLQLLVDCAHVMIIGVGPMTTLPYLFRVLYSVKKFKIPACVGFAVPVTYASTALFLAPKFGAMALASAFAVVWWLAFAVTSLTLNMKRPNGT
jgi:peptidoglycan biosynthesis protein MviN/MurJ (putative lipid II flippase)